MNERPECSIAIQVLPKTSDENVIPVVDEVIAHIKSKGLTTYVGPFETTVEGDFDTCMNLIRECQEITVKAGAVGVSSYVKIAFNPKAGVYSIAEKVDKHHA